MIALSAGLPRDLFVTVTAKLRERLGVKIWLRCLKKALGL